jgi:hypothetical protein
MLLRWLLVAAIALVPATTDLRAHLRSDLPPPAWQVAQGDAEQQHDHLGGSLLQFETGRVKVDVAGPHERCLSGR